MVAVAINGTTQTPPDFIVQWLHTFHNSYPFVGQLFLIMLLDVVSGILAACMAKNVSSTTCWGGMIRKAIMLIIVGLGVILEPYAQDVPLGKMIALCFTVVEGLSILENAARAGVPIPLVITDTLDKLKETTSNRRGSGNNSNNSGNVVNVAHAQNVDIHDTRPVTEVIQRGDSVIIKGSANEVVLTPEAVAQIVPTPTKL